MAVAGRGASGSYQKACLYQNLAARPALTDALCPPPLAGLAVSVLHVRSLKRPAGHAPTTAAQKLPEAVCDSSHVALV